MLLELLEEVLKPQVGGLVASHNISISALLILLKTLMGLQVAVALPIEGKEGRGQCVIVSQLLCRNGKIF